MRSSRHKAHKALGVLLITLFFLASATAQILPYKNGWEVKAYLGGVSVATNLAGKGTAYPDELPPYGWQRTGYTWGYQRMYFDPDGELYNKADWGMPNIEVEVGNIVFDKWETSIGAWTKDITRDKTITIGENKVEYTTEVYTFEMRIGATADITWLSDAPLFNHDIYRSETAFTGAGSFAGTPTIVTAYPVLEISPWSKRGETNEEIGAWIMAARLAKFEGYKEEVVNEIKAYGVGNAGLLTDQTGGTGAINMFEGIRGRKLETIEFSEGVIPTEGLRTSATFPISLEILPGYKHKVPYANGKYGLSPVPRDMIYRLEVEVLRTRNWEPEGGGGDQPKILPWREWFESVGTQWPILKMLGPELTLLLLIGAGLLLLVVIGPTFGITIGSLFGRFLK